MKNLKVAAVAMSVLALSAGGAFAQNTMSSDSMMKGMSKKDSMMMKKCQGMDHDMMMKSKSCMSMMKKHPDMMNSGDSSMMKH